MKKVIVKVVSGEQLRRLAVPVSSASGVMSRADVVAAVLAAPSLPLPNGVRRDFPETLGIEIDGFGLVRDDETLARALAAVAGTARKLKVAVVAVDVSAAVAATTDEQGAEGDEDDDDEVKQIDDDVVDDASTAAAAAVVEEVEEPHEENKNDKKRNDALLEQSLDEFQRRFQAYWDKKNSGGKSGGSGGKRKRKAGKQKQKKLLDSLDMDFPSSSDTDSDTDLTDYDDFADDMSLLSGMTSATVTTAGTLTALNSSRADMSDTDDAGMMASGLSAATEMTSSVVERVAAETMAQNVAANLMRLPLASPELARCSSSTEALFQAVMQTHNERFSTAFQGFTRSLVEDLRAQQHEQKAAHDARLREIVRVILREQRVMDDIEASDADNNNNNENNNDNNENNIHNKNKEQRLLEMCEGHPEVRREIAQHRLAMNVLKRRFKRKVQILVAEFDQYMKQLPPPPFLTPIHLPMRIVGRSYSWNLSLRCTDTIADVRKFLERVTAEMKDPLPDDVPVAFELHRQRVPSASSSASSSAPSPSASSSSLHSTVSTVVGDRFSEFCDNMRDGLFGQHSAGSGRRQGQAAAGASGWCVEAIPDENVTLAELRVTVGCELVVIPKFPNGNNKSDIDNNAAAAKSDDEDDDVPRHASESDGVLVDKVCKCYELELPRGSNEGQQQDNSVDSDHDNDGDDRKHVTGPEDGEGAGRATFVYFCCRDCEENFICEPCINECHRGHRIISFPICRRSPPSRSGVVCNCVNTGRCKHREAESAEVRLRAQVRQLQSMGFSSDDGEDGLLRVLRECDGDLQAAVARLVPS